VNSHPYFDIWFIFIYEILLGVHCEELEMQGEGARTHDDYEDSVEADDYEYLYEHTLVGLVASLVTSSILVLNDCDSHGGHDPCHLAHSVDPHDYHVLVPLLVRGCVNPSEKHVPEGIKTSEY
jgi:hypothetical protein